MLGLSANKTNVLNSYMHNLATKIRPKIVAQQVC